MESHRQGYRLSGQTRRRQAGITAIGFLILAVLVGIVGLAGIKLTPMFIKNMQLSRVLDDMQSQLRGQDGTSPATIRREIENRLNIESIDLPKDTIKIAQSKNGYAVHVQYENRAPYAAGVYLVLVFDKQVEIRK